METDRKKEAEEEKMSLITGAAVAVGKKAFEKTVQGLFSYLSQEGRSKIKQWSDKKKIGTLYQKIGKVRKVKTIWQVDKAVDLSEFYCDPHVLVKNSRKTIWELSDFDTEDHLLIEGIAGQGKSIFLRFLCAQELMRGQYIPLFIELRRIDGTHSLEDRIFTTFKTLGLTVDEELFDALAESGRIVLLLDAFDEVPEELKSSVLTEIEDLAATREKLRVIVTSRPHQSVRASSYFTVVELDNLREMEYASVLRKLASGEEWAESLVNHIEQQATHIKELLCTPLMVTLLVLLYKSFQKLPARLSEFYDALFHTLLQRHDGTKPGFTRPRRCELDDNEYRYVFEALCILAKRNERQSLSTKEIQQIAKEAIKLCDFSVKPSAYVDDIVKITSLILREGDEHRFIHKTVQEYYTASFVQRKPEPWSSEFYGKIVESDAALGWWQELEFLSDIDSYRYSKYFLLPSILAFLDISPRQLQEEYGPLSEDQLTKYLKSFFVRIDVSGGFLYWLTARTSDMPTFLMRDLLGRLRRIYMSERTTSAIREGQIVWDPAKTARQFRQTTSKSWVRRMFLDPPLHAAGPGTLYNGQKAIVLRGEALLEDKKTAADLLASANEYHHDLFQRAKKILTGLKKAENPSLLKGLL